MRVRHLALLLVLLAALGGAAELPALAQGPNRVALVVQHGDGTVVTRCVEFDEPSLTGYQILLRSGLEITASSGPLGTAICRIDGEGCDAGNCFCQMPGSYWSYWNLADGAWQYSPLGASARQVHNGDVEGWAWGAGSPP
ncbi:MAG: hypothetical protein H5T69_16430, partial [Chloroflexi bacterium]|nr:hypothetical protein [Chloroflexota bacterium]